MQNAVEARFQDCWFSQRLVQALVAAGYDHPVMLLRASWRELVLIVGVGKKGFAAIEEYRRRHGIPPRR